MMAENDRFCASHGRFEERFERLCSKIDSLEKILNIHLEGQRNALDLARKDMERRLEAMDEFRSQLSQQAGTFATVKEVRLEIEKMETKIKPFLDRELVSEGGHKWITYLITSIIAIVTVIVFNHFLK